MYITVHTAAATTAMPETKNISKLESSSPVMLSRVSKGSSQKSSSTTPMKVNAMRSRTSARRSRRFSSVRIIRPTPTMASDTPMVKGAAWFTSTPCHATTTPSRKASHPEVKGRHSAWLMLE